MVKFHNLLVMALVIIRRIHKGHITDRGAENPTGPKLPDFTLMEKCYFLKHIIHCQIMYFSVKYGLPT